MYKEKNTSETLFHSTLSDKESMGKTSPHNYFEISPISNNSEFCCPNAVLRLYLRVKTLHHFVCVVRVLNENFRSAKFLTNFLVLYPLVHRYLARASKCSIENELSPAFYTQCRSWSEEKDVHMSRTTHTYMHTYRPNPISIGILPALYARIDHRTQTIDAWHQIQHTNITNSEILTSFVLFINTKTHETSRKVENTRPLPTRSRLNPNL